MTHSKDISDLKSIDKCLAGNEMGYSEIYEKYGRSVYNSIYRILDNTADAEDLLQDTFVTIFKDIGALKAVVNLEAWIKRIAINKSISHLRKRKVKFTELDESQMKEDEDYDMEENEIFEGRISAVTNIIKDLPEGFRTIVTLYLFEQVSQEEIGKMLGISHNTVRTQYHRAKKKIMTTLKEKHYYG